MGRWFTNRNRWSQNSAPWFLLQYITVRRINASMTIFHFGWGLSIPAIDEIVFFFLKLGCFPYQMCLPHVASRILPAAWSTLYAPLPARRSFGQRFQLPHLQERRKTSGLGDVGRMRGEGLPKFLPWKMESGPSEQNWTSFWYLEFWTIPSGWWLRGLGTECLWLR